MNSNATPIMLGCLAATRDKAATAQVWSGLLYKTSSSSLDVEGTSDLSIYKHSVLATLEPATLHQTP